MRLKFFTGVVVAGCLSVGLAAQQTQGQQGQRQGRGGEQQDRPPVTVAGCIERDTTASTTGTGGGTGAAPAMFKLTNVEMKAGAGTGGTGTGGTGTGGTGTGGTGTGGAGTGRQGTPPTEIRLSTQGSDVDLAAHVGHKVELVGTMRGGRGRGPGDPAGGTGTGGTGTGGTATGGTGTGGTGTGTGAGRGTGTGTEQRGQGQQMMPTLAVTSLKMVSTTCSK